MRIPEPWSSIVGAAMGSGATALIVGKGEPRAFISTVAFVTSFAGLKLFALWRRKRSAVPAER